MVRLLLSRVREVSVAGGQCWAEDPLQEEDHQEVDHRLRHHLLPRQGHRRRDFGRQLLVLQTPVQTVQLGLQQPHLSLHGPRLPQSGLLLHLLV